MASSYQVDPARVIAKLTAKVNELTQQNALLEAGFEQLEEENKELKQSLSAAGASPVDPVAQS